MARETWRVIDTGLRRPAENIALNRALLETHQRGGTPHTLRFLRFTPSALLGYHQSAEQELRIDECRAQGIEIQRRITGGGAIYFDETQIGWELYLGRRTLGTPDMGEIARRICEAAAAGMSRMGIDARFRPRNDIEVEGRKISGTGGVFEGDSLLYQGTLLIDFDIERMLRVLRIPAEKLSDKAIRTARERMVNLRELLGQVPDIEVIQKHLTDAFAKAFDVEFQQQELMPEEERSFQEALRDIDCTGWVHQVQAPSADTPTVSAVHRCPGGLLKAELWLDRRREVIKQAWITGDFFINPKRAVLDLEVVLRDLPWRDVERAVDGFFASNAVEMLMLTPADFAAVIQGALQSAPATA